MPLKTDRRLLRTRQLLRQTLLELMAEKGYKNVTVTDIATRANINRGTFYLHYKDVPDMLEQLKEELFERISRHIAELDPRQVVEHANNGQVYPTAVKIFEEFAAHADFFKVLIGPKGDMSYAYRFKTFMAGHLHSRLALFQPDDRRLAVPREYIIAYMSSANLGVLLHWIDTGMQRTPQEMGAIMTQLVAKGALIAAGIVRG